MREWRQDEDLRAFHRMMAARLQANDHRTELTIEQLREGALGALEKFADRSDALEKAVASTDPAIGMPEIMGARQEAARQGADSANYLFLIVRKLAIHLEDLAIQEEEAARP